MGSNRVYPPTSHPLAAACAETENLHERQLTMSEELLPYTVSGVVDLAVGMPTTPLHVSDGHHDYDAFSSAEPLASTEQFRWVHVFAADRAAAAAPDALVADLRPGTDHDGPLPRALAGQAGLKPYTVVGVVRRVTGRLAADPVVVPGHNGLGAVFEGGWSTRSHLARVWARHETDAVHQVFGTGRAARADIMASGQQADATAPIMSGSEPAPARSASPSEGHRGTDEPQREWRRLEAVPLQARAELVADRGWQSGYSSGYPTAYTATAVRIAAAATDAAVANPRAWLTLQPLAVAASDAVARFRPGEQFAPPADRRTVASARAAAQAAIGAGRQPAPAVADVARSAGHTAGALAGTLTAATDVLIGWRARGGEALAGELTINGQPGRAWVADLLASTNRDTAAPFAPPRSAPSVGRLTAAQLARQDQTPDAAATSTTVPAAGAGRHRASATGAARHRRSR
jgi:hypothetical protein